MKARLESLVGEDIRAAYGIREKQARTDRLADASKKVAQAAEEESLDSTVASGLFKKMEKAIVRGQILDSGVRIDGRDLKTVRQISVETDILPRAH